MKVVLNAVAAKMGGAVNYVRHVVRELAVSGSGEFIVIVPAGLAAELGAAYPGIHLISSNAGDVGFLRRLWFDQVEVRRILRELKADVLFSTANFAMFACPCRQVLLVRNALYFSRLYDERVMPHKDLRSRIQIRLRRWLNCRSITIADVVMTPTSAMLDEVRYFVSVPAGKAVVNTYGVDPERFAPVAPRKFDPPYRLLYSSLYGEHKNFDTLLRALLLLADRGIEFVFVTPADPSSEDQRWAYTAKADAKLAADPRLKGRIRFTAKVPPDKIPHLYADADIFVYPAVMESFGHPLVEAMAAGLPIVAADVPPNREIAGDAAIYFKPFDPADCAVRITSVIADATLRDQLRNLAIERSRRFRWDSHVKRLLDACAETVDQVAVEARTAVS
jgi:glycosyltransferase involved in cell wall biosynthesis